MKKIILSTLLIAGLGTAAFAQPKVSNSGSISFESPKKKDVKAEAVSFTSKIDLTEKTVVFSVPVQSFTFKSAMMQKHFNEEGIMNSAEFPKAKFTGAIVTEADLSVDGTYDVMVNGEMTIKGVTKPFEAEGSITVEGGKITSKSTFVVNGQDFGIDAKKVSGFSDEIKVTLMAVYE